MATPYKFNYRDHVKVRILVIEAEDIEEGRDLAQKFCDEQSYKLIDICPYIFPIKEYLALSNGGKTPQGKPENFGQLVERRKLQEKEKVEAEKPIPAQPAPKTTAKK